MISGQCNISPIKNKLKKIVFYLHRNNKDIALNIKNSIFYLGPTILQFVISIYTLPLFSNELAPEDFAIIGYYSAISAFFFPLFQLNLTSYYLTNYYANKNVNNSDDLSFSLNFLNITNILVGLIGVLGVSLYFKFLDVKFPLLPYLLITLVFLFFDKFRTFYIIDSRIRKNGLSYLLISCSAIILNVLFSLLLVVEVKLGAAGKMAGPMISEIFIAMIIVIIWLRKSQFKFSFSFNKNKIKDAFIFSWPLVLSGYAYYPIGNIDKIFLERLNNPYEFGFYNVGFMVSNFVGVLFFAIYQSIEPDLYRFLHQNKKKKYALFLAGYLLVTLLISIGFIVFSNSILNVLTSGRYTKASIYANTFVIGLFFFRLGGFLEPYFKVKRETKMILVINVGVGIFSIISYYFMIQWMGFKGANINRIFVGVFYILMSIVAFLIYKGFYKK
jgi:O-antigen/teichoic acid export membrane protein